MPFPRSKDIYFYVKLILIKYDAGQDPIPKLIHCYCLKSAFYKCENCFISNSQRDFLETHLGCQYRNEKMRNPFVSQGMHSLLHH